MVAAHPGRDGPGRLDARRPRRCRPPARCRAPTAVAPAVGCGEQGPGVGLEAALLGSGRRPGGAGPAGCGCPRRAEVRRESSAHPIRRPASRRTCRAARRRCARSRGGRSPERVGDEGHHIEGAQRGGGRPRGGAGRSARPRCRARARAASATTWGRPARVKHRAVVVRVTVQVEQDGGGGVGRAGRCTRVVAALRDVDHALHQLERHPSSVTRRGPGAERHGPRGPCSEAPRRRGTEPLVGTRGSLGPESVSVRWCVSAPESAVGGGCRPGPCRRARWQRHQWAAEVTACDRRRRRRMRRRSRSEAPPQTPWSM